MGSAPGTGSAEGAEQEKLPVPYAALYVLALLLVLNFLALDLLRRLGGGLEPKDWLAFVGNISLVGLAACGLAVLLAAALWALERFRAGWSGPILVFLLYTVNLTFAKYRVGGWFESFALPARWGICAVALLAALPLGLLARPSLSALRDAVVRARRGLSLVLTLPFVLAGLLALLAARRGPAASSGPPGAAENSRPDVLMITIDTLAAADMSLYGYRRPTTPNLDRFAGEAVVFANARSASNTTNTSLPSYEGFYYASRVPGSSLLDNLRAAGYRDNLWVSFNIPEFFGVERPEHVRVVPAFEGSAAFRQLSRMFREQDLSWLAWLASEDWPYFVPYDARVGVEYHHYWLREHFSEERCLLAAGQHLLQSHQSPTFVWVHLWQPHYPYFPKPPFKGRFDSRPLPYPPMTNAVYTPGLQSAVDTLRRSYDEYILDVDSALGELLDQLRQAGRLEHTVVVIGSDHGESFEGGWVGHGGPWLTEALVHVPLLLRLPKGPRGERIESFVSPIDLAPTLLSLLGLPANPDLPGEDLGPYLSRPGLRSPRPKLSISYWAYTRGVGQVAVYSDRFKVLFSRQDPAGARVYDLVSDPLQKKDLSARFADRLKAVIQSVQWPER
jgi:arylsulfatase A-like enzyme